MTTIISGKTDLSLYMRNKDPAECKPVIKT